MLDVKYPEPSDVKVGEMPARDYEVPECTSINPSDISLVTVKPVMGSTYVLSRREAIFAQAYDRILSFLLPSISNIEEISSLGSIKRRFGGESVLKITDDLQRDIAASNNWNAQTFLTRYMPEQVLYERIQRLLARSINSDGDLIRLLFMLFMYANTREQVLASSTEIIIKNSVNDPYSFHLSLTDEFFDRILQRWVVLGDPIQNAKFINDIFLSVKNYLDDASAKAKTGKYDSIRSILPLISEKLVKTMLFNLIKNSQDVLYGRLGSMLMDIELTKDYVTELLKANDMYVAHDWINITNVIAEAQDVFSNTKLRGGSLTGEIVTVFRKLEATQRVFVLATKMHKARISNADVDYLYPAKASTYEMITREMQPRMLEQVERLISQLHLLDMWASEDATVNTLVDISLDDLGIEVITLEALKNAYIPPVISTTYYTKVGNVTQTERKYFDIDKLGFVKLRIESNDKLKPERFVIADMEAVSTSGNTDMARLPDQPIANLINTINLRNVDEQLKELQLDIRTVIDSSDIVEHIEIGKPMLETLTEDDLLSIDKVTRLFNSLNYIGDENTQYIKLNLSSSIELGNRIENDLLRLDGGIKINDRTGELYYPIRFRKEDIHKRVISLDSIVGQKQMDDDILAYIPSCMLNNPEFNQLLDIDTVRVAMKKNESGSGMLFAAAPLPIKRLGSVTTSEDKIIWASLPKPELRNHLSDGAMDLRPLRNTEKKWLLMLSSDMEYWRKQALRRFISLITYYSKNKLAADSIMYMNSIIHLISEMSKLNTASLMTFGATLAPMFASFLQVGWLSTTWREKRDVCLTYLADFNLSADALSKVILFAIVLEAYGYVHAIGNVDTRMSFIDAARAMGFRFDKGVIDSFMNESKDLTVPDFVEIIWNDPLFIAYARDEQDPSLNKLFSNDPKVTPASTGKQNINKR